MTATSCVRINAAGAESRISTHRWLLTSIPIGLTLLSATCLMVASALLPASASAQFISYFPVPNTCPPTTHPGLPCFGGIVLPDISAGPDGNLWFTEQDRYGYGSEGAAANRIGRITPSGELTRWSVDPSWSLGAIAPGPDGNMWFCVQTATLPSAGLLGRITLGGAIDLFPMPTTGFVPLSLTAGPDGRIWFVEFSMVPARLAVWRVGALTPASGQSYEQDLDGPAGWITAGPDGNLWINRGSSLTRLSPQGHRTEFPIPTPNSAPGGITVGPDGNLWFTEVEASQVGRMTLTGGVTEFPVAGDFPGKIVAGTDREMWFIEGDPSQLGRISLAGESTLLPILGTSITPGPDGNMWIAVGGGMSRLATAGSLVLPSRFAVGVTFLAPGGQVRPAHAVSLTPDTGYFWFFDASNVEVVVKVLNGCSTNGHYWFFASGLTNVGVQIEVTDTVTGAMKPYSNPSGTAFEPVQDTAAFPCP